MKIATEGWDAWSSWSLCDADGMQMRRRKCTVGDLEHGLAPGMCQGRSQEERVCIANLEGKHTTTIYYQKLVSILSTLVVNKPTFVDFSFTLSV